jgi:hypothetical protein
VFHSGLLEDGVCLPSVFGEIVVHELDYILPDWCLEYAWHLGGGCDVVFAVEIENANMWSAGHLLY